jgi:glycosyltransferase involved in cell wall biosynthesis
VQKAKGIGGSERHLLALLPGLMAKGIDAQMCVLTEGDGQRFVDALTASGVETAVVPGGLDADPRTAARVLRVVRRCRPDIVHTHLVHADLYGLSAARVVGIPGISSVHGAPAFYRRQPYRSVGQLCGRLARRRIAISHYVASFIRTQRLGRAADIRVVPYGIDPTEWFDERGRRERARRGWEVGDDFVIGIASRLIPGKGHELLIDAVARRALEGPVRLMVAGDGPCRGVLEARARARCPPGSVVFLGFVEDVREMMAGCDVLVVPTAPELSEGFGLAALEAMAIGRPVVVTAVGSLPEVVVDGQTGVVVQPGSVDELADRLFELGSHPDICRQLGAAGAARAREVFGLDAMVDHTVRVYEEVV